MRIAQAGLFRSIKKDLEILEEDLLESVKSDVPLVTEVGTHLVKSGGKRLRPMLMEASYQMFDGTNPAIDDFMDMFIDRTFTENGKSADYFAKLINDSGIALTRMSPDFSHFFLMAESAGKSIMPHFENISELKKVFAVFADEKTLNIICYLYSLPHMPVAVSLICKHTGYNHIEVEKIMRRLCDNHLVIRTMIATADGEMSSYSVRPEGFAVPLLCFADEIAKNNPRPFFGTFERKKPFL